MDMTDSAVRKAETFEGMESALRVLKIESEALVALAESLDGRFLEALDLLFNATGRVIVTGMGKSGHVGRKIAATMASTGTPAYFVHPGEASHGDLGMITQGDAVLALSNSGETTELSDVLAYTRRFAIPLIAITSRADSALGRAADVALVLPPSPEACPMGLAPTTSTTLALALGDALAVALLDRKGFSAADFRDLHPGGKLGSLLLKVGDIMHTGEAMPVVTIGTAMSEALIEMTAKRLGCVGVIDKAGLLIGIVTDGDLRRHMDPALLEQKVEDVMTSSPLAVDPDRMASEAVQLMNGKEVTTLFVVDNKCPVGILHLHDCLKAGVV